MAPAIEVTVLPLNDAWMRDIGPTFLLDRSGGLGAVDWVFNGWGQQAWATWDRDAEIALAFRIRKIATEPREVQVAWDQDRWADHGGYRRTPPREALATFAALRRSNLAYVGRLSAAQKAQHGRHPEYGRLTIPQMLAHWADHDLNHLEQIRAAHRRLAGRRRLRP